MTPLAILEELLRYRSVKPVETEWLSTFSHDKLCVEVQEKVEILLDSFEKYRHIAYNIQGPRDNGVDILLKVTHQEDEPERFVGLQVKSYRELEDRENGLSQKLKAGWVDAENHYGEKLWRYYVLLFGDAVMHAKRVAAITCEFAPSKRIRVIGPRNLTAFLKLSAASVSALVDRHLSAEDFVRKKARLECSHYSEKELYFLLSCICWALENSSDILPSDFFECDGRMQDVDARFGVGSVAHCRDSASDAELEVILRPHSVRIRIEHFEATRALYFDLQVRYGESGHVLFNHMYDFLNADG